MRFWNARRFSKFLLAGVTLFCISWIACLNEWHSGVRWVERRRMSRGVSTMRTIVAYSARKQEELDRPSPVTCDHLPAFPEVPNINRMWSPSSEESSDQWQHVAGTLVSLYAVYYDERSPQHYVRILAMFHGRNISTEKPLYCQTRPSSPLEETVEVVAARPLEMWWPGWDPESSKVETPILLSCPLTEPLYVPSIVSIVTEPCDNPNNAFQLKPNEGFIKYTRNFTICVKDMNFAKDISENLVEWIETNKILGIDAIDIYVDKLNKNTEKVLQYYNKRGFVQIHKSPIKYNLQRSLWQRRRDHMITYNECLYRNIRKSKFIIPLDIDEIILPKIANTLPQLIERLSNQGWKSNEYSAILIQNVFFFDFLQKQNTDNSLGSKSKIYIKRDDVRISSTNGLDTNKIELYNNNILDNSLEDIEDKECKIEPNPKIVRHVMRSSVISPVGYYSKSIMVTKKVLTAFNHYPLASLGSTGFNGWFAPFREVQLNHYKESCTASMVEECARYGTHARRDTAALRLRKSLTSALRHVMCSGIKFN